MRWQSVLATILVLSAVQHGEAVEWANAVVRTAAADPLVSWVGRTVVDKAAGSVTLDWPGTAARVSVQHASRLDLWVEDHTPGGSRLAVFARGVPGTLMGQRVQTLITTGGTRPYTVMAGPLLSQSGVPVTVEVMSIEERVFMGGNLTVLGFETDGQLLAAPPRKRKMEFVGDSITAGFGSAAVRPDCNGHIFNNDHALTWAHDLCHYFDADCFVEAVSGIGVACSLNNGYSCDPANTMPPMFLGQTLSGDKYDYGWDFNRFKPDALVINLGTNDLCCGKHLNQTYVKWYEDKYVAFVEAVHRHYGPIQYFLAFGSMTGVYGPAVMRVASRLRKSHPHPISAHAVDMVIPEEQRVLGCGMHPSQQLHSLMADKARPVISQVMGWTREDEEEGDGDATGDMRVPPSAWPSSSEGRVEVDRSSRSSGEKGSGAVAVKASHRSNPVKHGKKLRGKKGGK